MSVPEVAEQEPTLEEWAEARGNGELSHAGEELYDLAVRLHSDLKETRHAYDRCRKNKAVLNLLRKKALSERDQALGNEGEGSPD